jgi:hypothetical protein
VEAKDLVDEIKKCRVMCSNCHMEITHSKNSRTIDNIENKISIEQLETSLMEFENEQIIR